MLVDDFNGIFGFGENIVGKWQRDGETETFVERCSDEECPASSKVLSLHRHLRIGMAAIGELCEWRYPAAFDLAPEAVDMRSPQA